jgi:hypothetical protein
MKTITVDISECLYYLIPIVVTYYICYRLLLKDLSYYSEHPEVKDKIVAAIFAFFPTTGICIPYFVILYMILNSKFIIQL